MSKAYLKSRVDLIDALRKLPTELDAPAPEIYVREIKAMISEISKYPDSVEVCGYLQKALDAGSKRLADIELEYALQYLTVIILVHPSDIAPASSVVSGGAGATSGASAGGIEVIPPNKYQRDKARRANPFYVPRGLAYGGGANGFTVYNKAMCKKGISRVVNVAQWTKMKANGEAEPYIQQAKALCAERAVQSAALAAAGDDDDDEHEPRDDVGGDASVGADGPTSKSGALSMLTKGAKLVDGREPMAARKRKAKVSESISSEEVHGIATSSTTRSGGARTGGARSGGARRGSRK
jgi:hypothetical protein